jgi:hypothetical protein
VGTDEMHTFYDIRWSIPDIVKTVLKNKDFNRFRIYKKTGFSLFSLVHTIYLIQRVKKDDDLNRLGGGGERTTHFENLRESLDEN